MNSELTITEVIDMPNFTSGTWRITDRLGHEHRAIMIGSGYNGHVICTVSQHNHNREADTALICAAPELYHALSSIIDSVATCGDGTQVAQCDKSDFDQARAALARAIGETQ